MSSRSSASGSESGFHSPPPIHSVVLAAMDGDHKMKGRIAIAAVGASWGITYQQSKSLAGSGHSTLRMGPSYQFSTWTIFSGLSLQKKTGALNIDTYQAAEKCVYTFGVSTSTANKHTVPHAHPPHTHTCDRPQRRGSGEDSLPCTEVDSC